MCGIYGAVALDGGPLGSPERLAAMGSLLAHRGPDARRTLKRRDAAFGVERLRIVDLDPRADQPFECPLSGVWLAANGEIYNAAELRAAAPGYPWRSRSDVEPLLPLYLDALDSDDAEEPEVWLSRLDGMFALAIWDEGRRRLLLARDRAGEKPLFYARRGREVWFASEVRALLAVPGVARGVDEVALAHYLRFGYALEPRTLFSGIRSVPAGAALVWEDGDERLVRYWDPLSIASAGRGEAGGAGKAEVERLRELLAAAVAKQAAAEVPVGVFLSGGIDSSLIAALAAHTVQSRRGAEAIHTFTARFTASSYDESSPASRLAAALGTRHVEVRCDEAALGRALEAVLGRLATPLADPAILPTFLLAEAASERVRVVLAGEGADELFGGYPTYLGHKVAPWLGGLPAALRRPLAAAVGRLPSSGRKVTLEFLLKRLLAEAGRPWLDRHLAWFGSGLADLGGGVTHGLGAEDVAAHGAGYAPAPGEVGSELGAAMLLDYATYLRDDLLVKIDRATMLHSIEARAPYLDRDLQAFALALPERAKVRGLSGKWILKRAARAWLPRAVVGRRKRGLSVPVAAWINGGLAPEVDRLLARERLDRQGLLSGDAVSRLLAEHRAGAANHARPLWAAFVLEAWLERWHPSVD